MTTDMTTAGAMTDDDHASTGGAEDSTPVVLPWWQNPLNIVAMAVAGLLLGLAIGYVIGDSGASPKGNSVDTGFMQDMRIHHEQAIDLSYVYVTQVDVPYPRLQLIAEEILLSQQLEVGRMIQLLRDRGASEANDTETAMGWMNEEVPIAQMQGLASQSELDTFQAAINDQDWEQASRIFATLMVAHHLGGIHMAQYVIDNGDSAEVKAMAESMVRGQDAEVAELRAVLEQLG